MTILLDGRTLSLEEIERVASGPGERVELAADAAERMQASRAYIEERVTSGEPVYGVTTGFGRLADVTIAGLRSIPVGQRDAALACGHSEAEVFRYILLPQVTRIGVHTRMTLAPGATAVIVTPDQEEGREWAILVTLDRFEATDLRRRR